MHDYIININYGELSRERDRQMSEEVTTVPTINQHSKKLALDLVTSHSYSLKLARSRSLSLSQTHALAISLWTRVGARVELEWGPPVFDAHALCLEQIATTWPASGA